MTWVFWGLMVQSPRFLEFQVTGFRVRGLGFRFKLKGSLSASCCDAHHSTWSMNAAAMI